MRVDLPDGAWAELADPKKVSERKRRPLFGAVAELGKDRDLVDAVNSDDEKAAMFKAMESIDALVALNDLVVIAMVREWSFGDVSVDVLLDLPGDAYTALQEACAPHLNDLLPSFEVSPDPKADTGG